MTADTHEPTSPGHDPGGSRYPSPWGELPDVIVAAQATGKARVAFGYINMPDARPDRVRVVEQELRDGARAWGWSLGEVFHEEMPGSSEAFEQLQAALRRQRERRVVIASFTHFSPHRMVQDFMLQSLENDLNADVVALDEDGVPEDVLTLSATGRVAAQAMS